MYADNINFSLSYDDTLNNYDNTGVVTPLYQPIMDENPLVTIEPTQSLNETLNTTVGNIGNAVGVAGGTVLGNLLNNVVSGLGTGIQSQAGQAGATIVDSTLKEWFLKNWYFVIGGLIAFFISIRLITRQSKPKYKSYKK
jgi:hypothetical protein